MKSLAIAKTPDAVPTITTDSVAMATQMSVPDSSFLAVEFQKSDANHAYGQGGVAINTALSVPKKPVTVNAVDKTQVCTHWLHGIKY